MLDALKGRQLSDVDVECNNPRLSGSKGARQSAAQICIFIRPTHESKHRMPGYTRTKGSCPKTLRATGKELDVAQKTKEGFLFSNNARKTCLCINI